MQGLRNKVPRRCSELVREIPGDLGGTWTASVTFIYNGDMDGTGWVEAEYKEEKGEWV